MLWPIVVYFFAVVLLVAVIVVVSHLLGQRHEEPATGEPYEGGIVSEGSARLRVSVKFYLVAVFFVLFDLESAFLYAWAVAGRRAGWLGFWEMVVFALILLATLAYLWRIGALDWSISRRGARR